MKEDCGAEVRREIGTQLVNTSPVKKETILKECTEIHLNLKSPNHYPQVCIYYYSISLCLMYDDININY